MTLPRPHSNCYWVRPGSLLAGEYPGDLDEAVAVGKLSALLGAGVTFFLDLTEPYEPGRVAPLQPYLSLLQTEAAARALRVTHRRMSIQDYGLPRSPSEMSAILDTLDAAVAAGERVYVHCWGGIGRTGTVVGCYLVRHGLTGHAALAQLAEWWQTVEKSAWHPRSPQTDAQVAYVRHWQEPGPPQISP